MAQQIGTVTVAYGTATASGPEGERALTPDSPVYADDEITTGGSGSAVEITFNDGAVLSQGPDSSIVLDTYVFDPDQSTGAMTVKLLEGTFRSVTGEIVDMNPRRLFPRNAAGHHRYPRHDHGSYHRSQWPGRPRCGRLRG